VSWLPSKFTLKEALEKAVMPTKLGESFRKYVLAAIPWEQTVLNQQIIDLEDWLKEWLRKNNLYEDMEAHQVVWDLVGQVRPMLQKSLTENPSLEEELNKRFPPAKTKPGQGPDAYELDDLDLLKDTPPRNTPMPPSFIPNADSLAKGLTKLADMADENGLTKEADAITELLPSLVLLKVAQYESPQHYWMMNGRAFEKSWREKRKKKNTDDTSYHGDDPAYYRSAHECWWETLEEYQESLLGNHDKWLSKYADKKTKSKNVETEEGCSGMNPSSTMSKEMTENHKEMEGEGTSPGKGIVEWLNSKNHKASGLILMEKVAKRIGKGSSPGVAFYKSMDEMISGSYLSEITSKIRTATANVKQAAMDNNEITAQADDVIVSLAQVWDTIKDIGKGVGQGLQDAWTGTKGYMGIGGGSGWDRWRTGPLVALVQKMRDAYGDFVTYLNSVQRHGADRATLRKKINPVWSPYKQFLMEAEKKGYPLNYPDFTQIWKDKERLSPDDLEELRSQLSQSVGDLMQNGEDLAVDIQQAEQKAKPINKVDKTIATPSEVANAEEPTPAENTVDNTPDMTPEQVVKPPADSWRSWMPVAPEPEPEPEPLQEQINNLTQENERLKTLIKDFEQKQKGAAPAQAISAPRVPRIQTSPSG
jgi:hypothetical protein